MKIGIITYPDILDGKGRFLQAYSLYSYIEQQGYEVEIIDYEKTVDMSKSARIQRLIKRLSVNEIASYIGKRISAKKMEVIKGERRIQREKYSNFIRDNIRMSRKIGCIYELSRYIEQFDAVVCGSDQIWNPYFVGLDPVYYLQFVEKNKRISYAASLGTVLIDKEKLNIITKWISTIPYCSVREESAKQLLKENSIESVAVLDPTFLMSSNWWRDFANIPSTKERPYVLSLYFDNGNEPRDFARTLCERFSLDEVNIPETIMDVEKKDVIKEACLSPNEFVSLFANAEYVVTQSYHGVILSILFKKKFFVLNRTTKLYVSGVFSRIEDLLKKLDLEDRIVNEESAFDNLDKEIDYSVVYDKIAFYSQISKEFLNKALLSACSSTSTNLCSNFTCTGCAACVDTCNFNAITLEEGDDGFLYPVINSEKCIHCRRCEMVCPNKHSKSKFMTPKTVYACVSNDSKNLEESTSGGFFGVVARLILNMHGAVAGCEMNRDLEARHIVINSEDEIVRLKKSKYVQSYTAEIHKEIRTTLEEGKKVLFSGTPCQVDGLLSYLHKDYENLYTMDIVCHGVPSQLLYDKVISYFNKKFHDKVLNYQMRDNVWRPDFKSYIVLEKQGLKKLEKHKGDIYKNAFLNNLSLRRSCYTCAYARPERVADITIADAWGIKDDQLPGVERAKGISMVSVNTLKGEYLFDKIKEEINYQEVKIEQFISSQPSLKGPAKINCKRDEFIMEVLNNGVTKKSIKLAGEDETKIRRIKHRIERMLGEERYNSFVKTAKKVIDR